MSAPDPESESQSGSASEGEEVLLDINGNPIPRNWNPMAAPRLRPPDAEPPTAARKPALGSRAPGNRPPSNGTRPAAPRPYQPPVRSVLGGGFTPGSGGVPGQEEVRYDLAGNPLPVQPSSYAAEKPAYMPPPVRPGGSAPQRKSGGGGNPLGIVFALLLLGLIAGAGYVMYTKYQANQKTLAAPVL